MFVYETSAVFIPLKLDEVMGTGLWKLLQTAALIFPATRSGVFY